MQHTQLKLRMVLSGVLLFGIYAGFVAVFRQLFTLPVLIAGTLVFVVIQYALARWLALRSANATALDETNYADVHEAADRLSSEMGIAKPDLYLAEMGTPNAFAVGRRGSSAVVLSESLLELLHADEWEAVLAHELAHVRNRDSVVMVLGQSIAAIVSTVVFWVVALADDSFVAVVVGWLVSGIVNVIIMAIVMVVSRHREYVADSVAAEHTNETALAEALAKIEQLNRSDKTAEVDSTVGALCITQGDRGLLARLLASHPPMLARIARLDPSLLEDDPDS